MQAALPGGGDVAKRRPAATGAAAERRAKGAAALAAREREWEAVHLARLELEEVHVFERTLSFKELCSFVSCPN